jgi:hypothetical protein
MAQVHCADHEYEYYHNNSSHDNGSDVQKHAAATSWSIDPTLLLGGTLPLTSPSALPLTSTSASTSSLPLTSPSIPTLMISDKDAIDLSDLNLNDLDSVMTIGHVDTMNVAMASEGLKRARFNEEE